jgi:hypothetical protein
MRPREKRGRRHAMSCDHNLKEYLVAYLDGARRRGAGKPFHGAEAENGGFGGCFRLSPVTRSTIMGPH